MINYLRTINVNPQIILRSHSILKSIPSFSSSHIHHKRRKFPVGSYKNQLEELCAKNTKHQVKSLLKGQIGKDMNVKKGDVDSITDKIVKEFETNKSYFYIHRIYVQKH